MPDSPIEEKPLPLNTNKDNQIAVLHVLSSAGVAGGERYIYDLINKSSKAIQHYVILPYPGDFCNALVLLEARYDVVNMRKKVSLSAVLQLIRHIKDKNIDIVHTHGYRANFFGRIAALFCRVKSICTVHVSLFDYIDTPPPVRLIYLVVEKALSFKTSRYLCISRAMQQDIVRMGVDRDKTTIIPNGVDISLFHPRKKSRKYIKKYRLHCNPHPVIGTVGRLVSEKGHHHLLQALVRLKKEYKDVKCLIVGDGPRLGDLLRQAQSMDLQKNCRFTGIIHDVEKIYPLLDVFVLPSLREPFGLVLLEAMATGIPVVAMDTGGPSEFIQPGLNGLLARPGDPTHLADQIAKLLSDKKRAQDLAKKGFETVVRHFDVGMTSRLIIREYQAVLKG